MRAGDQRKFELAGLAGMMFAAAMLVIAGRAHAEQPPLSAAELLERLRSEGVAGWEAMADKMSRCSFEYSLSEIDHTGSTPMERKKRVSGRLAGECFLFTETIASTGHDCVYGRNDRYEFELLRSGSSPWTISWQSGRRDDATPVGSAHAYLAGMLQLPFKISATPLAALVRDPRFSIQHVRAGEGGLIEFSFAVAPAAAETDDNLQQLSSGLVVLDSNKYWAIVQYQARYGGRMSSSVQLSYAADGPPKLSRARFKLQSGPQRWSEFAIDVGKYDWSDTGTAEFTLPQFGLPDYEDPSANRRRLALINIGIIFLLSGLILWRRRQGVAVTS
jgi:hypothetical protein